MNNHNGRRSEGATKREAAFEARPKTEVYLNPKGNIVIRQTDAHGEPSADESFVWFEPEQIDALIQWLEEVKEERLSDDWQPDEEEEDVETSHP